MHTCFLASNRCINTVEVTHAPWSTWVCKGSCAANVHVRALPSMCWLLVHTYGVKGKDNLAEQMVMWRRQRHRHWPQHNSKWLCDKSTVHQRANICIDYRTHVCAAWTQTQSQTQIDTNKSDPLAAGHMFVQHGHKPKVRHRLTK